MIASAGRAPPVSRVWLAFRASERMRQPMCDWPQSGWNNHEVSEPYRLALLRGVAAGHFPRRASSSNM